MSDRGVADVLGPWTDPGFDSGLIRRCKQYWYTPVNAIPNEALATYLRQRIALGITIPEAQQRVAGGIDDGSELYEGELAEALRGACNDPNNDHARTD
jgi:hypothetical protein